MHRFFFRRDATRVVLWVVCVSCQRVSGSRRFTSEEIMACYGRKLRLGNRKEVMMTRFIGLLCAVALMACSSPGTTEDTQGADNDAGIHDDVGVPLSGLDDDKDGLPNDAEAVVGTDPSNPDTDGDGLNDGDEFAHGSNPLIKDTDGDGIEDGQEVTAGTSPRDSDTDFDGFDDAAEAAAGTDPNNAFKWPYGSETWPDLRHYAEGTYGEGLEIGDVIPNFAFIDQFDQPVELYQFHDTLVLLDFSAGWCNPCREAAATSQALWEEYREQGFTIIHMLTETSTGAPGDLALQTSWANEYGISFPVVRQNGNTTFEHFKKSDVYFGSLPFMVLLDRDMRINSAFGAKSEEQVRAKLDELLGQSAGELLGQHPLGTLAGIENADICDIDADGFKRLSCGGDDCNDHSEAVFPGADENCQNKDHNCDGRIHEGASDAFEIYLDVDRDGFGDPDSPAMFCQLQWPYSAEGTDCDDTDEELNPNTLWYADVDQDGAGDPNSSVQGCEQPDGYVRNAQDPNDNDPNAAGCWQSVTVGRNFSCGLRLDGRIKCWGLDDPSDPDDLGQVTGTPTDSGYIQVSAGLYHGCGLRPDGSVNCWGSDKNGASSPPPSAVFSSIDCGLNVCCGITDESGNNLTCWGDNMDGRATPPEGTFSKVDMFGWFHVCGLKTDGSVVCWGREEGKGNSPSPTVVPTGTYTDVAAGHFFTCTLDEADAMNCWGTNTAGQATAPSGTFSSVHGGVVHACGLRTDGTIACFGSPTLDRTNSPAGTFAQVDTNQLHSCALGSGGLIQCWGFADQGSTVPAGCGD